MTKQLLATWRLIRYARQSNTILFLKIINTLNINCDTNINHNLAYEIKTQHIYDTKG